MDSDSEDYVVIGTSFEREESSRSYRQKKPSASSLATTKALPAHLQVPTDAEGRRRFHGAFEGGLIKEQRRQCHCFVRRCLQALDDHVRLGEALIAVVRQRRTPPAPVLGQPVTRWRVAFAHGTARHEVAPALAQRRRRVGRAACS